MKERKGRNWAALLKLYPEPCKAAVSLVRRFVARETVCEVLENKLREDHSIGRKTAKTEALYIFKFAKRRLKGENYSDDWSQRLVHIFGGKYPRNTREFLKDGEFVQRRYREGKTGSKNCTFISNEYEQFHPCGPVVPQMAPALHSIEYLGGKSVKYRVNRTPEVERFLNLEAQTISKSALVELEAHNRPLSGIRAGWTYTPGHPPRQVVTPVLTYPSKDPDFILEFLRDLKSTFAWEDDQSYGSYVAYLIQALVNHHLPGQVPGYVFLGDPKSGKGYLAGVLSGIFYRRQGSPCVSLKRIPTSDYELEVLLSSIRNAVYLVFDEVALVEATHMKAIDSLLTASNLSVRKLQRGYQTIPNSFTVALTAVDIGLSDETAARLAVVKLTDSRPEEIAKFHRRWIDKGPQLLASLFHRVNSVKIDLDKTPSIPDRRPGFGLLAQILEEAFTIKVSFPMLAVRPEILDLACQLFADVAAKKQSGWKIYSLKAFQDFYAEKRQKPIDKKDLESLVSTALPYGRSTRAHPIYKRTGYQSDNGRFFHIELRKDSQRQNLFVQEVETTKSWATTGLKNKPQKPQIHRLN